MKPLSKGDTCRVRLHAGEVVEAVYDEPSRVEKDHWVRVNGIACRATNYTSDERPLRVIFVGPPCVLVPVGGECMNQYRVELRTGHGSTKTIDVMAYDHAQAKYRAERQSNMVVLSTQLIG